MGGRRQRRATWPSCSPPPASCPPGGPSFDPDDPRFLPPGDMPARIAARPARGTGSRAAGAPAGARPLHPRQPRRGLRAAPCATPTELSGRPVDVVHVVGGGARNALLCQLTADACGLRARRTGRGDGPRQRAGPGPRSRAARRRPGDAARRWCRATQDSDATSRGRPARAARRGRERLSRRCASRCSSPASTTRCSRRSGGPPCACWSGSASRSTSRPARPAAARCTSTPATATSACRWSRASSTRSTGYDAVVTPSASCAAMVRHHHPVVASWPSAGDDRRSPRPVGEVAPRVYELSEFLVDVLGVTDVGAHVPAHA